MIKVLFCSVKWEYGKEGNGISFVYQNFFDSLDSMPEVEAKFFGLDEKMSVMGRDKMNEDLIREVAEWQPDVLFCMLFTEELKKETISFITHKTKTQTINWFADDHWRFSIFSKYWAPLFTAVATTDSKAPDKYRKIGVNKVIKTQWAANPRLYCPKKHLESLVTPVFVGEKYGNRGKLIQTLKEAGISVQARGKGWSEGRVKFEQLVELFGNCNLVLNFTDSPYIGMKANLKLISKFFLRKDLDKLHLNVMNFFDTWEYVRSVGRKQIKARVFEVPACGGFLLTAPADNIEDYFVPGKEIEIFNSADELVDKTKYYLDNPKAREQIAMAGHKRVLAEHTYEIRFREIFKFLELL